MAKRAKVLRRPGDQAMRRRRKTNDKPAAHPFNNKANHEKLLKHVIERLDFGNEVRDEFVLRLQTIDREFSGFVKLSEADKKRERDNLAGKAPKPTDVNLQLAATHIEEAVTFLMSVFAPDSGMFEATARQDKQSVANAFAAVLNRQSSRGRFYREYVKAFANMLKYNLGGWFTYWEKVQGNQLTNTIDGQPNLSRKIIWQGNRIKSIDMYNVIWDIAVHPVDLPYLGEFVAFVEMVREFRVKKMAEDGELFEVHRFTGENMATDNTNRYYKSKPQIRNELGLAGGGGETDWVNVLTQGGSREVTSGHELVTYYGWLNPREFGLSNDDELQIWRIVVVNQQFIAQTEYMNNAHGMLPVAFASPREDDLGFGQKSYGEMLIPLQRYASFKLNVDQQSQRKSLHGITVFDANTVALDNIDESEVAGRIRANPTSQDVDLRKKIMQLRDAPDTTGTMRDIASIVDLMQKLLPTDMLRQVADLQRATTYQAAAVVQSANRRNYNIARLINDHAMHTMKFQLMYNLFQYQEPMEMLADDGTVIEVTPSEFRDAGIEYAVGEGLKGIDRLLIADVMKEILTSVLQSQQAAAEIDVVKLLDYYSSLLGDKTDISSFRRQVQPPQQQITGAAPTDMRMQDQTGGV